ncbi:AAA family ATPase [Paracoccus sp. R12_1]|uniref:AAA family ATPase n=1 Tax=unclassified Paracoccus (in: a-proteobacteria) TaxID=2688777 RepID=UPI001AD96637|nr:MULTISPECIES: AAA family ATPase [unclassified Paracoccus (in: a-proteobacteria)]MBO9454646.1 AAA family ATPase [Paracoccus sp. R12_2]MBO9487276.1 AAA family ATPase [Paracoccus sp. R12_1]
MTENPESSSTSSLPAWSIKAAGASMHHGARIHHIMSYFGVEFTPNNVRIAWAAVRAARLEQHHVHARQIALIKSDGQCMDYAQLLVRWTALETAAAAEAEYHRICRELRDDGVDPRVLAAECRRTVLVQLSRNGIFAADGQPLPGTEEARARALTSAHVAAYYDHDKPQDQVLSKLVQSRASEKEKEKQQKAAEDDGLLNWLDDEHFGKTISDEPGISEVIPGEIPTVRIYKAAQKFTRSDDARAQTSERLEKKLELRGVATESEATEAISIVYGEHSWFSEPLDYIWKRRQDAIEDGRPWFQVPPILIWGPPGCGKTHFLSRLAELSGVQYRRLDYSSVEGGMSIAGTDARWSNSRPGAIVETIAQTGCANPLFFIDEIEKAKKNHGASDPHHALLPLLQRDTAKTFFDQSLSARVDLSFVSYVFAANEIWPIPAPLLDRVRVFEVRYPRGKQLRDLIERRLSKCGASEEVIDKVHTEIEAGRHTLRILDRIEMRLREVMRQPVLN